eukprot:TRINITY_DN10895_c0_g1_i2.p1 TRINITY_DN10895_c0_g1~~TRINITY_DN10895_c0_g1_i2.p1  ORF type:complete len:121 (+),score=35.17 TRINITY_DN10895_c0_g1_i2:239-601(+)
MSTGVPAAGELLCVDELERKLTNLSELVELKKEEVRSNFRQLHTLLLLRETFLLKKMDDIVTLARQEVAEKANLRESNNVSQENTQISEELEDCPDDQEHEMLSPIPRGIEVSYIELEWN